MKPIERSWMLELEDGTRFRGRPCGAVVPAAGEVVFNTAMTGYPETLTDPSYRGQILVFTYPMIGNYGVPPASSKDRFESDRIQVSAALMALAVDAPWRDEAGRTLRAWLAAEGIPALEDLDTRALTLHLRERGTLLGRILPADASALVPFHDPNRVPIVAEVSGQAPELHGRGDRRVVLVDCGAKRAIRRELVARGLEVLQVPHDHDYTGERFDGIVVSNGPGNPEQCGATIAVLRRALVLGRPFFGICLGSQLLALAAGARTYKLRYGHRGQNQPCLEEGTPRCFLTSQNHGYAVDESTLPPEWQVWFRNANDGSVEGIRHRRAPFRAVQFHPEASPGPRDTGFLFDDFVRSLP